LARTKTSLEGPILLRQNITPRETSDIIHAILSDKSYYLNFSKIIHAYLIGEGHIQNFNLRNKDLGTKL